MLQEEFSAAGQQRDYKNVVIRSAEKTLVNTSNNITVNVMAAINNIITLLVRPEIKASETFSIP